MLQVANESETWSNRMRRDSFGSDGHIAFRHRERTDKNMKILSFYSRDPKLTPSELYC